MAACLHKMATSGCCHQIELADSRRTSPKQCYPMERIGQPISDAGQQLRCGSRMFLVVISLLLSILDRVLVVESSAMQQNKTFAVGHSQNQIIQFPSHDRDDIVNNNPKLLNRHYIGVNHVELRSLDDSARLGNPIQVRESNQTSRDDRGQSRSKKNRRKKKKSTKPINKLQNNTSTIPDALIEVPLSTDSKLTENDRVSEQEFDGGIERADFNIVLPASRTAALDEPGDNKVRRMPRVGMGQADDIFQLDPAQDQEQRLGSYSTKVGTFIERPLEHTRNKNSSASLLHKKRKKSKRVSSMTNDQRDLQSKQRINTSEAFVHADLAANHDNTRLMDHPSIYNPEVRASDHILVKPGFDDSPDDGSFAASQNYRAAPKPNRMDMGEPLDRRLPGSDPAGRINDNENDNPLIASHRPVLARDLLHVGRPQQRQQVRIEDGQSFSLHGPHQRPHYTAGGLTDAGPLYESHLPYASPGVLQHRAPMLPAYTLQDHLQRQYEPPQTTNNHGGQHVGALKRQENERHRPYQAASPPPPPPPTLEQPISPLIAAQRYEGHPLLAPLLNGYPPQRQPDYLRNIARNEPNQMPLNHPVQHLLEAARNQQAAALSYERRRLNYERELRERENGMRRHHEAKLEQQRLAAEQQRAAADAETRSKQQDKEGEEKAAPVRDKNGEIGAQGDQQTKPASGSEKQSEDNTEQQQGDNNSGPVQQPTADPGEDTSGQNNQTNEEPEELKGFHGFGSDTDFTDLFPPGVLSKADIEEMRRQQQEQQQQQQQQPQEQEEQDAGDNNSPDQPTQDQQGEPNRADEQNQQQQQQQQQQAEVNANQTNSAAKPAEKRDEIKKQEVKQEPITVKNTNSSTSGQQNQAVVAINASSSSSPSKELPMYIFKNVSDQGTRKTRRSHASTTNQPLIVLDSEYHDRYVEPFLLTMPPVARRRAPSASAKPLFHLAQMPSIEAQFVEPQESSLAPGEPRDDLRGSPLVQFDDLFDEYEAQSFS